MRNYIYKVLIFTLAIIIIFEFTLGKYINKFDQQLNLFTSSEGRKEIISSLKKEIQKANEKDNYLDQEERILIKTFIKKIKKELELNN
jgi:hypothetical protein|tara:strand:+ start:870 stop:1133 length:264 start_codon:yes stop_codon:yes gene_type:complete